MSSDERRIAPRKAFTIPIKFHAPASSSASATARVVSPMSEGLTNARPTILAATKPTRVLDLQEGITVNLSEREIYFKSAQKMSLGQSVELYLTLPRELTGRSPEPVRCKARVVHIEPAVDDRGWTGVGAEVEQFEPLQKFRTWDN